MLLGVISGGLCTQKQPGTLNFGLLPNQLASKVQIEVNAGRAPCHLLHVLCRADARVQPAAAVSLAAVARSTAGQLKGVAA